MASAGDDKIRERKMPITACFIISHVYRINHAIQAGRRQFLTRPRLQSQPTTCDDASQERGREPIKELTEDDEWMKADEKGGLKNDRQRHCAPDGDGEDHPTGKSAGKNATVKGQARAE